MAAKRNAASAKRVRALKKRTGYSNREAAGILGVHVRTFNRWLSGESPPPKGMFLP